MKQQIDQLFAHVRQGVTVILDNHSVPHSVHALVHWFRILRTSTVQSSAWGLQLLDP